MRPAGLGGWPDSRDCPSRPVAEPRQGGRAHWASLPPVLAPGLPGTSYLPVALGDTESGTCPEPGSPGARGQLTVGPERQVTTRPETGHMRPPEPATTFPSPAICSWDPHAASHMVSPQILDNKPCDPRPHTSCPHGQGGSNSTGYRVGGMGGELSQGDGPEAQSDGEVACQPHTTAPKRTREGQLGG